MITSQERKELADKLALVSCSVKDKTIFRTKFGIDDGIYKSNVETGKIFGISHEAVRLVLKKVSDLFE